MVVLPDPDSPAIPYISPEFIVKLTDFTAWFWEVIRLKNPVLIGKDLLRFETLIISSISEFVFLTSITLSPKSGGTLSINLIVYWCFGFLKIFSRLLVSTIFPFCITYIRSAISLTTPRLWVMNNRDKPSSFTKEFKRSSISFWVVTSNAVPGSSAIRSLGLFNKDIPIRTLCLMPPDSIIGYELRILS